ncbi:MAG: 16S rRNA (guanine(966)-N(2))-methyltransferase RsmD [Chloroflexota bacterium]|nr:16S rRNA (guanine(966)-N(2))-methyltransferase RsmD [Chloroflexota bacterium]
MRVIAGTAKGHALRGPRTPKSGASPIRPTSDKVRGALFDIIGAEIVGARVLDLYAGTGALAIEALSRGAKEAELVEADREALELIAANLAHTHLEQRARVRRQRVEKALEGLEGRYDVILADPPYADAGLISLLTEIARRGLVEQQGLVAIEHASRVALPDVIANLHLLKHRRHGDTTVSLYRAVDAGAEGAGQAAGGA